MYSEYYDYDVEERTDFDYAVGELLNKEIARQLKEKVKDYESVKEKQIEYQRNVNDLNSQIKELQKCVRDSESKIDKINHQHKDEIKNIKDEFGKNYLETIIGDWKNQSKAYYNKRRDTYRKCPHCNGNKKEEIKANEQIFKVDCRFCNGDGSIRDIEMTCDYENIKDIVVIYRFGLPYLAMNTYSGVKELKDYYQKENMVKQQAEQFNNERTDKLLIRYAEFKKKNNIE